MTRDLHFNKWKTREPSKLHLHCWFGKNLGEARGSTVENPGPSLVGGYVGSTEERGPQQMTRVQYILHPDFNKAECQIQRYTNLIRKKCIVFREKHYNIYHVFTRWLWQTKWTAKCAGELIWYIITFLNAWMRTHCSWERNSTVVQQLSLWCSSSKYLLIPLIWLLTFPDDPDV